MITAFISDDDAILRDITDFCTLRGWVIDVGKLVCGRWECRLYVDPNRIKDINSGLPPLQDVFEIGYQLCRLQEMRITEQGGSES